ncbi:hypothetical protein [Methylorubrum salsuginis]|uniref:hypothetical protein n=1 Tax=Methylorubrum salsuginis TaxID=414703 RepID=UPI001041D19B|nr:hypothetical protein [Methylorubrum salsuginis]
MTERKNAPKWQDMPFGETLARLLKARPDEAAASIASTVFGDDEKDKEHKNRVEEALENGARRARGRFRI